MVFYWCLFCVAIFSVRRTGMHRMRAAYLLVTVVCAATKAVPLTQIRVDLTHPFDENSLTYPILDNPVKFTLKVDILHINELRVQIEEFSSGTHIGTHIDAPAHHFPGATTVDQLPLDQLIGPAAVIDITARASLDPNAELTVEDLVQWEATTGQTLNDTIVLMRSGWGKLYNNRTLYYGTPDDDSSKVRFPGVSPEAAVWMVTERKVKGAGVDTLSFDRALTSDFLSHQALLGNGRFILENVANLENVPLCGAILDVQPMKIANAGGAPVRIVATYPVSNTEL